MHEMMEKCLPGDFANIKKNKIKKIDKHEKEEMKKKKSQN